MRNTQILCLLTVFVMEVLLLLNVLNGFHNSIFSVFSKLCEIGCLLNAKVKFERGTEQTLKIETILQLEEDATTSS